MVSTNADYIKTTESSTNKSELIDVGAASMEDVSPTTATTKHTLLDFSDDLVCSTNTGNSSLTTTSTSKTSKSQSQTATNFLLRLQGQRWQQNFDFEKVLKQMRHAEKAHFKMFEVESYSSGSNIGGSNSSGGSSSKASSIAAVPVATGSGATLSIKAKLFKYPQRFQVKRLNGNDMHYYSLAPKHQALKIVVCNACKGIYTIVGFSNHMMRQHPAIWSSVPSKTQNPHTYSFEAMATSSAKSSQTAAVDIGQRDDTQLPELQRIELVGISSDSSATASSSTSSSSTSSSLASSFGITARATKGNRNSSSSSIAAMNIGGSVVSSSGRSRTKTGKQHLPAATTVISTITTSSSPAAATALTLPANLQSVASPSPVTELLLTPVLASSSNTKSVSKKSSVTGLSQTPTTPATLPNVTTKVLPTFGIASGGSGASITNSNSNPLPTLGISSFSNSSSNSSTSSSSSSSTTSSSKTSSQSTTSTPSLTFPTLLSMPLADASNNATGQFEIVSSTTAYYVDNIGKDIQSGNNFSTDSFEKTDDNATITSISDIVPVSSLTPLTPTNHVSSATIPQNVKEASVGEQQLINPTVVSDSLSSTPKVTFLPEQIYESSFNGGGDSQLNKTDIIASESVISSSVDALQPTTEQQSNSNSITQYDGSTERLQLATVSTSGISPTLDLSNNKSYYKLTAPHQTFLSNTINLDKVCGVTVHSEFSTPCMRPLICNMHTQSAKRQVNGRSKPFDELLLSYCSNKDDKQYVLQVPDVVDSSNSSSSTDFERRNIFGSTISPSSCAAGRKISTQESNLDNNTLNSNSLPSLKFAKSEVDKGIIQLDTNERAHSSVSVNILSQHQPRAKLSCEERALHPNSSDENSILTLEGIFDHTTQLEMLSSKFITEILNTDESDINFDDLDTANNPTTQTTRLLPAAKRLRLDDNIVPQRQHEVDNSGEFTTTLKPQQQHLPTNVSDRNIRSLNQNNEHKNNLVHEPSSQHHQQQQQIEIQYQTELSNVLQQEQITAIEAMQFQQLLYQQCSFNNLETTAAVLEQQQHNQIDTACLLNNKELIELSAAEKCYSTDNTKNMLENYSNLTAAPNKAWSEYNIDDVDSNEAIEWRLNVTQMPSLTDETPATNEITLDNLVHLSSSHTHSNSTAQYALPAEDELLFEITADNQVSIINQQQQQVIAEILTQAADYNNSNLYASLEHHHITNKKPIVSYDFSRIETFKSLLNCMNSKSKSTITTKHAYDDVNLSFNIHNGVPRPLSINYFGLVKLPLTLATTFRKDLLTARKANNNPITFSSGNSSSTVHTMNSRYNTSSSVKHITNANSGIASVGTNSGHYTTNLVNEFYIGSITVTANITKQQKNGTLESVHHSPSNNINSNLPSSTNGSISSPPVNNNSNNITTRHQQKTITSLGNTIMNNNFGCLNGKNKTGITSTSIAPIAIVNPTSRLSTSSSSSTVHTKNNNSNIINNSNYIHNLHRSSSINHNHNAVGNDRVKLIKRAPISKFSNLKSTYFTPKILSELLIGNGNAVTANILSIQNGIHNCDNAIQAHTIKYYRNNSRYSFYGKRLISKLGQREQRTNSFQHNYSTALNSISSMRERKLKSRQVSLLP